MLKRLYWF